jgi:uncharacterized cupin superfamily protein
MTDAKKSPLVRAADAAKAEGRFSHPWNPKSEIRGAMLGRMAGLQRTGVNLARIAPGKESFTYHSHANEEEWMYVITGKAIAEIDGTEHEVGPGDFLGFPTPSVPHHLWNPFSEELVYLSGGEHKETEIADFPRLNKRMIRKGNHIEVHQLDQAKPFP